MAKNLSFAITIDGKTGIATIKNAKGEIQKMGKVATTTTAAGATGFGKLWKAVAVGNVVSRGVTSAMRTAQQAIRQTWGAATDFEKKFANVTTLLDISGKATDQMRKDVLGLAGELGSATELTEGLYQALSAGVAPAKAVEFVGKSAKFAKAGLTDMRASVDVLTTVLNAYGMEADKVTHVSDMLFQVIKDGKTTGQELASSLGRLIPTAATMKVGLNEVGASMAVLTKSGLKTDEAVTSMNATLMAVIGASDEIRKAAKGMGVDFTRAGIEGAGGLQKWLAKVKDSIGDNEVAMTKLFPNVRALKAIFTLTGAQAKAYSEELLKMNHVSGNTEKAFRKQMLTFDATAAAVKNKLVASLTTALLPVLRDLRVWLNENKTAFEGIGKAIGQGIKIFFSLVKVLWDLRGVLIAIAKIAAAVWAYNKIISYKAAVMGASAAVMGLVQKYQLLRVMGAGTFKSLKEVILHSTKNMGLFGKGVAIAGAAFVGWKIGRAISDLLGLDKAVTKAWTSVLDFTGILKKSTGVITETQKAQAAAATYIRDTAKALGSTSLSLAKNAQAIKANKKEYQALPPHVRKVVDGLTKTKTALDKVREAAAGKGGTGKGTGGGAAGAVGRVVEEITVFEMALGDSQKEAATHRKTLADLRGTIEGVIDPTHVASDATKHYGYDHVFLAEKLGMTADKLAGLQKLVAGVTRIFSEAMGVVNDLGIELSVGLGYAVDVAGYGLDGLSQFLSGDFVGAAASALKAVVSLGKAIGELFGGDGVGEAINRRIGKWGIEITEKMEEKIREVEAATGDTGTAFALLADEIIRTGEVTVDNFAGYAQMVRDILSQVDSGKMTAAAATKELGEGFAELAKKAKDLGTEGSAAMLAIIGDVQNRGLQVKEINEYILEQTKQGITALQDYTLAGGENIAAYSQAFFESLRRSGHSLLEIVNVMGSSLPEGMRKFAEENENVLTQLGNTQKVLEALGNTNALTAEAFKASQSEAHKYYAQMMKTGADEKTVLEAMAPLLAKQMYYAKQYNMELDDRTKKHIKDAQALGINLEGMIPLEELQRKQAANIERMADVMETLVDRLSGAAKGWDKFGKAAAGAVGAASGINKIKLPGTTSRRRTAGDVDGFASGTGGAWVRTPGIFTLAEDRPELVELRRGGREMRVTPERGVNPGMGRRYGGGQVVINFEEGAIQTTNQIEVSDTGGDARRFAADLMEVTRNNTDDSIGFLIERRIKPAVKEVIDNG